MTYIPFFLYLCIIAAISLLSRQAHLTSQDFMLGSRKMNFWLTALAAHASDMSSWIFMGYPAVIYMLGLSQLWLAIGLVFFMFLNWTWIAPKIRIATEGYNSITLSSFFESRLADTSGKIRIFSALISFLFYTVYISAGFVGLGQLLETIFGLPYELSLLAGFVIVIPYLFVSGYITLAWTDLFQGLFLLAIILFVPFYMIGQLGGWHAINLAIASKPNFNSFLPSWTVESVLGSLFLAFSWGLGYFGQPHILTKFMGIRDPKEIPKARFIGIGWQILTLGGATVIGLVAIAYFQRPLVNSELVFIDIVREQFSPFIATFILCAILGVTITTMGSFLLVVTSNLTEDFYKKIFRKEASNKELVIVSRLGILIAALCSLCIALARPSSIFTLVEYAWFGLGSTFGPLLLCSLYFKKLNHQGAWAGILIGGLTAAFWPLTNLAMPTLIPAFFFSLVAIITGSLLTQRSSS